MDFQGELTSRGETLRKQALAGAGTLTFTRAAAGSGSTQTSAGTLAEEKQALALGEPRYTDHGAVLPADLTAAQAASAYQLKEVGLYARDGAGETLYCIYRAPQALTVSPASAMSIRFELEDTSLDAPEVEVPVAGYITVPDLAGYVRTEALADYAKASSLSSYVTTSALDKLKGAANGLATLDSAGDVPMTQLPISFGTQDLTAGQSALKSGTLHFVYE